MKLQIVTTITTIVDVETMDPEHSVAINAEDAGGLGRAGIMAAVSGGLKSALAAIQQGEA